MRVLVTGAAGFIGYHLTHRLLAAGHEVVAVDVLNHYYDITLKHARLLALGIDAASIQPGRGIRSSSLDGLTFIQVALEDGLATERALERAEFDVICHLAAQAGVRHSLENPRTYIDSNVHGFLTILEMARKRGIRHTVYGSSSSVYGERSDPPFSETDVVDEPVSLYAVTKRTNELMAASHARLFGLALTGLRFFTVYGPYGRPDMAYYDFARRIFRGETINVFNHGEMSRDFTCVRDTVEALSRVIETGPATAHGHRLYNVGRGHPVRLLDFIEAIETACGRVADKRFLPMQPGDVSITWANTRRFEEEYGFRPVVPLEEGVAEFVEWFRRYHGVT